MGWARKPETPEKVKVKVEQDLEAAEGENWRPRDGGAGERWGETPEGVAGGTPPKARPRPKKPHRCEECGRVFNWRTHLVRHRRLHTGQWPHKCSFCGKGFNDQSPLLFHEMLHRGERPHKCLVCGKKFRQSSHLLSHRAVHADEKPYVCADCGKSFARHQYLLMHRRVHTGERPYKCRDCGKSFRKSSDLVRHQTVHTGEKPFKCPVCGKGFTQNFRCNAHKRAHNEEEAERAAAPPRRPPPTAAPPAGDGQRREENSQPGGSCQGDPNGSSVRMRMDDGCWAPGEAEGLKAEPAAESRPGEAPPEEPGRAGDPQGGKTSEVGPTPSPRARPEGGTSQKPPPCREGGKSLNLRLPHEPHGGDGPRRCPEGGSCCRTQSSWMSHLKMHLQ
ncbi:uncharacterized protein LOC141936932 [Strix uralensis]|uniref:uncharacterized protein LOC141936932 n=1 Tax=Strix uralensis TaxID=36305 RepID=UPI003DA74857